MVHPDIASGAAAGLAAALLACGRTGPDLADRIDAAAARARAFLVAAQDADGAWRSSTYGALKDGLSLTPPVLKALLFSRGGPGERAAIERGLAFVAGAVRADGSIDAGPFGLVYPVYTASLAVILLTLDPGEEREEVRSAWLALLSRHQLTEDLGWEPTDAAYGGWGYALEPLVRSGRGPEQAFDADISSTLFALGALRIAGVPSDDPRVRRARYFVERCQNWPAEGEARDPSFDDGGFFFTPTNDLQNKAGTCGVDARGRKRYASYGSATSDGIRALLSCGLPRDHPRVAASLAWIERHFDPKSNPGRFEPAREAERDAPYYYGCWSLAHALVELGVVELATPRGRLDWRAELSAELLARQGEDGAWRSRYGFVKEDDPLIATGFALAAIEIARLSRSGIGSNEPRPQGQ